MLTRSPVVGVVAVVVLALTASCSALPKNTKQTPAVQAVNPAYIAAGSADILVTASGQNFMQNSAILWNGVKQTTMLVASGNLQASIPATNIANPGTATVTVRNPYGLISNPVTVTVLAPSAPPLIITTTSLPGATYGTAYSATVTASGGTPPYACSLASGTLPPGLVLMASTCQIAGTPGSTGTYAFSARVTDSGSPTQAGSQALSIVVAAASTPAPAPLNIVTSSLPGGTTGVSYGATLVASGGTPAYSWIISSGALPPGLVLGATTGQISGTPSSTGTYTFSVKVTDSGSPARTVSQSRSIAVAAASPPTPAPLSIVTGSLPGGTTGVSYSATLVASGGTPAYTWGITSGSLPPGLILSGTTGQISGVPSASGTYSFNVALSDSGSPVQSTSKSFSISVVAPTVLPISITTTSLPSITVGTPYSATLSATGGIPPYTWSVSSGALPAGLTLSAAGAISGTPTAEGTNSFTVQVTDSAP
jgi:hypothetical protein